MSHAISIYLPSWVVHEILKGNDRKKAADLGVSRSTILAYER